MSSGYERFRSHVGPQEPLSLIHHTGTPPYPVMMRRRNFRGARSRSPVGRRRRQAERALTRRYRAYLGRRGHDVVQQLPFKPPGEPPLFCDLYDRTQGLLVEAKAKATRQAVREAIGQLADYARFFRDLQGRAVLFPAQPRQDLVELLAGCGIMVVYEHPEAEFVHLRPEHVPRWVKPVPSPPAQGVLLIGW